MKIFQELKDARSDYETISLEKIDGLKRNQFKVIKMCEYYSDSKYLGTYLGNKKQVGDAFIEVPFYNVVNYRVSLAATATDMDIKDFQIKSDNPKHQVAAMLLNKEAYEWMKESGFAKTLNDMGHTRPKYGGYLIKKTETKDDLDISVVRWTNVVTDQNNILGGPIIERHDMSPVAIKKKDGAWDDVDDVLRAHLKVKKQDRPSTIDVYEITGEFPLAVFKDAKELESSEEDEYTFSLQRYFVAELAGKNYLLSAMELDGEMTDYYEYLSWEDNGYGLGRGIIEDSEEAQVWTNDAVINEYIAMTLAGRVGIKTDSKKVGGNVLAHDHGKVYELEPGSEIGAFSLAPAALGHYTNLIEKWKSQATDTAFSHSALTGEQQPSGTPYAQTAFLNQVASKPYDQKREDWGIHLTKVFENWVIPFLIKKISKEHILVSDFTETELELIDASFAAHRSNKELVNKVIDLQPGEVLDPMVQEELKQSWRDFVRGTGRTRFIEVPKDYFKGITPKVTVITTGEQKNKAVLMQSLSEILKSVVQTFNPQTGTFGMLDNPELRVIFNEIMDWANPGISLPAPKGNSGPIPMPAPEAPTAPEAPMMAA